jgi:hypothetical protein
VIVGQLIVALPAGRGSLLAGTDEQAVKLAERSLSRYASLVIAAAAGNAYARGDFRRSRELTREAIQGARVSPLPGQVLGPAFMFVTPKSLASELATAIEILDEVHADSWDYAEVHACAAAMAAIIGNLDLAQPEAVIAVEIARRVGNPTVIALALYAFGMAYWQSDPTAAQAALEEHVEIARATGYTYALARSLALVAQLRTRNGGLPAALEALREGLHSAHINGDRPAMAVCLARGAVVLVALGELEAASVFLAAVTDGVLSRLGAIPPNEAAYFNELVITMRSRLGQERHIAATARGAALTYEQVNAFALAAVEAL